MLDRNLPFYNIILKCNCYKSSEILLPKGFRFKQFHEGDEKAWAKLEYEIGDFESIDEAEEYFISNYCGDINVLKKRCVFIENDKNEIVGSCIAWKDKKETATVASLHWLIVTPDYQGKKLGKSLCQKTMQIFHEMNEYPVYIHTQPWSYKAILLYIHQGFQLQMTDSFSHYENQYIQAMDTLKSILPEQQYHELVSNSI